MYKNSKIEIDSDKKVASTAIAQNLSTKKDDDMPPIWWEVKAWGYQADVLNMFEKGDKVHVSGHVNQETWKGRDGELKSKLVIVADDIYQCVRV